MAEKRTDRASRPSSAPYAEHVPTPREKRAREKAIRRQMKADRKKRNKAVAAARKQKKKRAADPAPERTAAVRRPARDPAERNYGAPGREEEPPAPRITHSQARRHRFRRRLLLTAVVAAVIALGAALSLTVLFRIEEFRVEGDCAYTQDELVGAFGHGIGENMFRFRVSDAEQRMQLTLPYLESVRVRRRLPGTIVFIVSAAQPAYFIASDSGNLLLSSSVRVLEANGEAGSLCRLDGLSASDQTPGQLYASGDADRDSLISSVLSSLQSSGISGVTEVDFTDSYELSFLYCGRIRVRLGANSQIEYKLEVVKKALENEFFTATTTGSIDASDAGKAIFKPGTV